MKIPDGVDMYDIARFFSRVEVRKQPKCWIYKASINYDKYPSFSLHNKTVAGHRFCYEVFNGPIPENMVIRHKCDNVKCVNPYHLETGTHQDNMLDRLVRNRTPRGVKNGRAVLNEQNVMDIVADNRTYKEIAMEYNVCPDTIKNIHHGRSWSHVTGIKQRKG